jgi:drug/metabolite transporter (DMT)-like permease
MSEVRGIAFALGGLFCLAVEKIAVHALPSCAYEAFALRAVANLVLIGIVTLGTQRLAIRSSHPKIQITRGLLSAPGLLASFVAFANLPLVDATALSYTRAIFMMLLASLLLRESTHAHQWFGIAAGMLGALLIVQPGFVEFNPLYLVALAAPALNACQVIASKAAVAADSPNTTMWWITLFNLAFAAPAPVLASWQLTSAMVLPLTIVLVSGPLGMYLTLWAVRYANVAAIAPFDYTRLLIATAAALVIFHETPNFWKYLGIIVIVVGLLVSSWRPNHRSPAAVRVG